MTEKKGDIRIDYLAKWPGLVGVVARWSFREWLQYRGDKSLAGVVKRMEERLNVDRLPLGLVAVRGGEAMGMVSLKVHDMDGREELTPWMAGLYVAEEYRKQGIGTLLIEASLKEAQRLGIGHIYLWTAGLDEYYAQRGWGLVEQVVYKGQEVTIMERELE